MPCFHTEFQKRRSYYSANTNHIKERKLQPLRRHSLDWTRIHSTPPSLPGETLNRWYGRNWKGRLFPVLIGIVSLSRSSLLEPDHRHPRLQSTPFITATLVSLIARIYFSQTSVIYFCLGLSCYTCYRSQD